MATQRYTVTQQAVDTLFAEVRTGKIAIPEIQRPFVWNAAKVRDFLDSLYQGFPVGYLIAWLNPDVRLKDGTLSTGKKILIDGQQRVTALMAALLGMEVVTKDYRQVRIRIAFHPIERRFEVANPAILKDPIWIPDISVLFSDNVGLITFVNDFCARNPGASPDAIAGSIQELKGIGSNHLGVIELGHDLDIETVTEIFIRVNSAGVPLSQADFAMSKIAVDTAHGGHLLRKAIDYFCHLAVAPHLLTVVKQDTAFAASEYLPMMSWMGGDNESIYDPSYVDMLRVAFTSQFARGPMNELVALLSGRNFDTRQFEEAVIEDAFARLKHGALRFMNETNFKQFVLIIKSAGFVDPKMIGSQNALNFAYVLFLALKDQAFLNPVAIQEHVRRWFVMSLLTGRYSGSFETQFSIDVRQVTPNGFLGYVDIVMRGQLSDAFWDVTLPERLQTSATASPFFRVFLASQVKMNDRGFLSKDITVSDLIQVKSDVHHLFPRAYLKKAGFGQSDYNQIANYAVTQSEINIAIGDRAPNDYVARVVDQIASGAPLEDYRYSAIADTAGLSENFRMNCIPDAMERKTAADYPRFLAERRTLMSRKMRAYFEAL